MTALQDESNRQPRIAVTLGDQAGIGSELVVKLLCNAENLKKAQVTLLAGREELNSASRQANQADLPLSNTPAANVIQLLDDESSLSEPVPVGQESVEAGARCMYQLRRAVNLWRAGKIDAIVFAPLNKTSMKMAGMSEEDELRWLARQLDFHGTTSEINIAGPLWTARVTSHVGLEKVASMISKESTLSAIRLLHRLRWEAGIDNPRIGVCALNPHNGENGNFGRQEIDTIRPAVREAQAEGVNVSGPFPCDTIFLKRASFDGILTMYHDQGQIAMKLLSFEGGVTVQGGLPVIVTTPAHGTAFDIVGKNIASLASMQNAFDIAVTMASRRLSQ